MTGRSRTRASSHAPMPDGPGRGEVDEVVAALGQRLDDRREAGDADLQAPVEGDVDLGHRAQAAVDVAVGADHLDLVAGDAALADLLDRVGDPVHAAEAVGDERHPRPVAVRAGELELLAAQEGRRGGVGDAGMQASNSAVAWRPRSRAVASGSATISWTAWASLRSWMRRARRHRSGWLSSPSWSSSSSVCLVDGVGGVDIHRDQPGAQQRPGVVGAEVGAGACRGGRRPRA